MILIDLYPHTCRQCGKKFEGGSEWAYKIPLGHRKAIWFCSWKCIQAYRKEHKRHG